MELYEALKHHYENYDEDARLLSRHGSVEFLTTIRYVEKYLQKNMRILEIGAGTGRYAHHFARQGFEVDAVELIPHNIEIFNRHTHPEENIRIYEGNALDLSMLQDERYDAVLLLGPMYHLYTPEEKRKAMAEALRVLKTGGVLFVAYCMADASIIQFAFGKGLWKSLVEENLLHPDTFETRSTPKELFELVRLEQIDEINRNFQVKRLHFVGTDMFTHYFRAMIDEMDEEAFAFYLKYHFCICERQDMAGLSNHTLDILQKTGNA